MATPANLLNSIDRSEPLHRDWLDQQTAIAEQFTQPPSIQAQFDFRFIRKYPAIVYRPELKTEQPMALEYIKRFAKRHQFRVQVDRRKADVIQTVERRRQAAPIMSLGISLLLQQTGLANATTLPSMPHAISVGDLTPNILNLLEVAKVVRDSGRHFSLHANNFLLIDDKENESIESWAANVPQFNNSRIAYFEADRFHGVVHKTNNYLVFSVVAGGGFITDPQVWGPVTRMTREPVTLQLYEMPSGPRKGELFGVLFTAYILDLNPRDTQPHWWNGGSDSLQQMQ